MSKNMKNVLLLGFFVIFFVVGFLGFKNSLPANKNHRVYEEVKPYLPYTLEKRLGGFSIVYKDGQEKEKPTNAEIFHITDKLDKAWGKEFLTFENDNLIILNSEKKEIKRLILSPEEKAWVKDFFGI